MLRDRPYVTVSGLNAILTVHIPLLSVVFPLWIASRTHAPHVVVSALLLVNTVMVILLQVPVSRRYETVTTAIRGIRIASILLCATCVMFWLSSGRSATMAAGLLVIGALPHVFAEMTQGAASWALSYELAPNDRIGEYQGLFNAAESVVQLAAPSLLTLLLVSWHGPGWLVFGALLLVVAVVGPMIGRAAVASHVPRSDVVS